MRNKGLSCILVGIATIAVAACGPTREEPEKTTARAITFNRDIAPILFDNCASCHRPIDDTPSPLASARAATSGPVSPKPLAEADPICVAGAPFSVLDYDSVRRHAGAIASAVQRRAMPP